MVLWATLLPLQFGDQCAHFEKALDPLEGLWQKLGDTICDCLNIIHNKFGFVFCLCVGFFRGKLDQNGPMHVLTRMPAKHVLMSKYCE